MNANELRIGNYVCFDNDTYIDRFNKVGVNIFRVCLIGDGLVKIDIGHGAVQRFEIAPIFSPSLSDLNPIPLTEEWLLKFGFKKWQWCDDCAYIKYGSKYLFLRKWKGKWIGYITSISKEGTDRALTSATGKFTLIKCPQYVHSLQNLYFALTGTELTLNKEQ